jgi:hypothetical protein
MGMRERRGELATWSQLIIIEVYKEHLQLTKVTFIECLLRSRSERFETSKPGIRFGFNFVIVRINRPRPRPVCHGLWQIEHVALAVVHVNSDCLSERAGPVRQKSHFIAIQTLRFLLYHEILRT